MDRSLRIHIVGAGIAGLTTALALRRAGFSTVVFEQSAQLGEVGAGLTIGPNAARVLLHLGLEDALQPFVRVPRHVGVLDGISGKTQSVRDRGPAYQSEFGAPLWHIHRADLIQVLAEALAPQPADLSLGHQLEQIDQDTDRVTVSFKHGASSSCDLLIACDGLKSGVRDQLFPGDPPRYTGYAAWRGLAERSRLPDPAIHPDFAIYTGPNRFFARYAVRQRSLVNIVALAQQPDWDQESWSLKADIQQVKDAYRGWHRGIHDLLDAIPAGQCFRWALHVRDPLDQWVSGRVALLGDAAHPMTPFLGLGAAIGIEDGLIMARCLSDSESVEDALARYQSARISRANRVQSESARQGLYLLNRDPSQAADRSMMGEDPIGLYGYDAVSVAI